MKPLTPLEKILLGVVGVILLGVTGWYVSHVERINTAQWNKMQRIEERVNKYHTE